MIFLVATILLNTILVVIFKLFPKYGIDGRQAIVFNYITCLLIGSLLLGHFPVGSASVDKPWFPWALLMGCVFITLFNLIAWRTRKDGITTTATASKLSLVIPVLFSVFLYDETLNAGKIAGFILAFPAVYFTSKVKEEGSQSASIFWPAILFIFSGLLDTLVKYVEDSYLSQVDEQLAYIIHVFTTTSLLGTIWITAALLTGRMHFAWRNVWAGMILGLPNYFSIYFLIRLLHSDFMQSSAAIPVNNIGIVLLSALSAVFFFKEKATPQRIFGLILSIISILLIAFADLNGSDT